MNDLATLLTSFDISILFDVAERLANVLSTTITPVLLIIAIYIRLMETQLDGLVGNGKYGTAVKDIILWSFVLGSYWGITNLVFAFFNPVYQWFDTYGSLAATMGTFSKVMTQNKAALDANGLTLTGVIAVPYALVAMFFYYGTLVVVAFISAFLKIANVLILCVALVWGFIAIPVSISQTLNVLKGWGLLVALALVWPIMQGILMMMFGMLFLNSAASLNDITEMDATIRAANIMMLFTVMHLLLAAVLVSAPFIANALVSNSSAVTGLVMPFVAAATAAGVATIKGGQAQGMIPSGSGGLTNSVSRVAGSNNTYRTPVARGATASFAKNNPAPSVYSAAQAAKGGVSQPSSFTSKLDSGASGGTGADISRKDFSAQPPANFGSKGKDAPADAGAEKKQQRRGVLVRQNLNKRTKA